MTKVLVTESYLDDIADAIRAKANVSTEYKPSQMAGAIMDIDTHDTHDATASAGDVLTGKTAYIATGKVSGTMPNQGAIVGTIDAENPSYTVPEGYHSGLGTVSADVATTAEVEAYVGRIKKLVSKTITENGTYNAEDDNVGGYSQVTVNVPNSYGASDEGKVVSNGELVAQTARASEITANGTYDTTKNNSVTVNVSGSSSFITPTFSGLSYAYLYGSGSFVADASKSNYLTLFEIGAGTYVLFESSPSGNRFRSGFYEGMDYSDFSEYIANSHNNQIIYTASQYYNSDSNTSVRYYYEVTNPGTLIIVSSNESQNVPSVLVKI